MYSDVYESKVVVLRVNSKKIYLFASLMMFTKLIPRNFEVVHGQCQLTV